MKRRKASFTVEMSFLMPIILMLIMSCMFGIFYSHDKNVIAGAAYETAVVGSTKMREKEAVSSGELNALFAERVGKKCIFFSGCSAEISVGKDEIVVSALAFKGKLSLSVLKRAKVSQPETVIRDVRRVKEVVGGAKNKH